MVFAVLLPFVAHRAADRGARRQRQPARPRGRHRAAGQGHPRRARQPHPGRDHRAAGAARRPRAAAAAPAARADHGVHGPLPRRGHRRDAADEDRPRVPRLHRPQPAALAGAGPLGRRAVHPLLRARRAGAPGDAVARLHRAECPSHDHPRPRRPRPGLRLPRRPPGALRRRPARPPGRAGRAARPQRRRQDHAGAAPQRHPHRRRRQRSSVSGLPVEKANLAEIRRRVGIVFQDPDDQLFMGTVRADVAFGPANLGHQGRRARPPGACTRSSRSGWRSTSTARRTTSPSASAAGSRSRPCWRWSRRSWCSTSRRPTSTRPRAASSPTSCARST